MVHQLENQWLVEHMSLQCTRKLMALKSISPECKYPVYSVYSYIIMSTCHLNVCVGLWGLVLSTRLMARYV